MTSPTLRPKLLDLRGGARGRLKRKVTSTRRAERRNKRREGVILAAYMHSVHDPTPSIIQLSSQVPHRGPAEPSMHCVGVEMFAYVTLH